MSSLNAHERPPEALRKIFKAYQRLPSEELDSDAGIVDFQSPACGQEQFRSFAVELASALDLQRLPSGLPPFHGAAIESKKLPGLYILPRLFSVSSQLWLLERLLHRDLADERHLTNLHAHYAVTYKHSEPEKPEAEEGAEGAESRQRRSFFNAPPDSPATFEPLDPTVHKPLLLSHALNRKLRWVTLGGQYDWTAKAYPDREHPDFPSDVANLVRHVFPGTRPEAAIVNIYSPGDTLSLHRDVSEESAEGLVSVSIGCDGIFVIGSVQDDGSTEHLTVRLRSGDALLMSSKARYAWHGVPRIVPGTCPPDIASWPSYGPSDGGHADATAPPSPYASWDGWMAGKRINLNIRQMWN